MKKSFYSILFISGIVLAMGSVSETRAEAPVDVGIVNVDHSHEFIVPVVSIEELQFENHRTLTTAFDMALPAIADAELPLASVEYRFLSDMPAPMPIDRYEGKLLELYSRVHSPPDIC